VITSTELDERAYHVHFEVVTLVNQMEFYIDEYGPTFPIGSSTTAEVQALLEAVLVHLRLLDEFLRSTSRHGDAVRACDWPGWSKKGFLTKTVRQEINAHVAHLSSRRATVQEWDLPALGVDACALALKFFDAIQPKRLPAFLNAPEVAAWGHGRFTTELAE
jgi:tryptophan 2,3-dioxygenase